MSNCVNKNHPDFLQLVEETGINPILLAAKVGVWMEENGSEDFPTSKDLGLTNNLVDQDESISSSFSTGQLTPQQIHTQSKHLQNTFRKVNINIPIISDTTLNSSAAIGQVEGNWRIAYNPNRVREDSLFHEHGHILVDLIDDREFIQQGINQLRGTTLWNNIAKLYTNLNEDQLGKEVLTTAIGLNARDIFNEQQLPMWRFWWNRFMDRLTQLIYKIIPHSPVENKEYTTSIALNLAKQLVNGDITHTLDRNLKLYENQQLDEANVRFLDGVRNYLIARKNETASILRRYPITTKNETFMNETEKANIAISVLNAVDENTLIETYDAVATTLKYDYYVLGQLESRLTHLYNNYLVKNVALKDLPKDEYLSFTRAMRETFLFLSSYNAIKSLGNLTANDIKELSEDDKAEYARMHDVILRAQKDMLPRIPALESQFNELMALNTEYVLQFSTNPNAQMRNFVKDVMLTDYDENKLQLYLDALMDSNNILASNIAKLSRIHEGIAALRAKELTQEYWQARDRLKEYKSKALGDILFDSNGQLYKEYEYDRFYDDLNKTLAPFKKDSPEYVKARSEFYKNNTEYKVDPKTIQALFEEKRATLNDIEYREWEERQRSEINSHIYYKITGEIVQPKANYRNNQFEYIQNNEDLKNLYTTIAKLLATATSTYKYSPQSEGFLPAITDGPMKKGAEHGEDVELMNSAGEIVNYLNLKYVGYLNADSTLRFRKKHESETDESYEKEVIKELTRTGQITENQFQSLEEIHNYNNEVIKKNKKQHGEAVSRDLDEVIPKFLESSMQFQEKQDIEDSLLLALTTLKQQKMKSLSFMGKVKHSQFKDIEGNPIESTYNGETSNALRHAQLYMKMIFYDKFLEPSKGDALLSSMKNYASVLGMGFNVFAAIKNITFGGYMTAAEAASGRFYSREDLMEANKQYFGSYTSYLGDIGNKYKGTSTFENALIHHFDLIEAYDELFELQDSAISKEFATRMFMDAAFAGQHMGEHMMHNMTLFSMLNSYRLVNGKVMNLYEYTNTMKKTVTRDMTPEQVDEVRNSNKVIAETLQTDFETHPKMRDVFEMNEGFIKVKDEHKEVFTDKDFVIFKEKIRGVNHKIHGIYNKGDKGTAENHMIGQLALQYRHWARPGWNKRFGSRGGLNLQPFWNERRDENDQGDYLMTWKYLTTPFRDNNKENWISPDQRNFYNAAQAIVRDYGKMLVRARYYWHRMSDEEKAGIRRTAMEISELATVMVLSRLLIGFANDDDKLKKNRYYNFLLYQLSASATELAVYTPIYGWFNESGKILQNPTATYGNLVNGYKLAKVAFMYPFIDDEDRYFQGGYFNNKLKVGVYANRFIPVANVLQRIDALDRQRTAYKLY